MADPRPGPVPAAPQPSTDENETPLVEAGVEADDPGGAHDKGYTADPPGTRPRIDPEPYRLRPDEPGQK